MLLKRACLVVILMIFFTSNASGFNDETKAMHVDSNIIDASVAYDNALVFLNNFIDAGAPGFNTAVMSEATLNKSYVTIYDINDNRLFYEFLIELKEEPIGMIRASAKQSMGNRACSIHVDPTNALCTQDTDGLVNSLQKEYPNFSIESYNFVCYSYPKVGIKVIMENLVSGENKILYMGLDGSLIPLSDIRPMDDELSKNGIAQQKALKKMPGFTINVAFGAMALNVSVIRRRK